jgi:hypothetical protein
MHTSLFAVKSWVNLINAQKALRNGALMGRVYSEWRYRRPDSCSIPSKMESWLSRQTMRLNLASHSIFSGRLLAEKGGKLRERREHVSAPPKTKEMPFQPSSRPLGEGIMKQAA